MSRLFIAGVGMTPFGRHPDLSVKALVAAATGAALADAGAEIRTIEAAFFGSVLASLLQNQHCIPGQVALRAMGFERLPVFNVENACATGASALHLAAAWLRAGAAEVALAVGVEKMTGYDRARTFSAFDGGWDVETAEANAATLLALGRDVVEPPGSRSEQPYSAFMDVYAAMARWHMTRFGTTQRQFAAVSAKNHAHAVANPNAFHRRAFSIEDVLNDPPITYPLTRAMCAPVTDGSAAVILCTERGLARLGVSRRRAIELRATALVSGSSRDIDDLHAHLSARAARKAYEAAGIEPSDVSVAEVHDATAVGEIIQAEALDLCGIGEGGTFAESGATTIGGRLPINPSGGLESRGHPLGATGLAQIHELVSQLRGEAGARQVEGARVAIAENGGGLIGIEEAVAAVTILASHQG
jgi:acetyl-CoA acyltransferase